MALRGTLPSNKSIAVWKFDEASGTVWTDSKAGYTLTPGSAPAIVATTTGNGLSFTTGNYLLTSAIPAIQNMPLSDWTVMFWYTPNNNFSEFETAMSIHSPAGNNELLGIYIDPGFDHVRVQWHDSTIALRTCDLAVTIDANVKHHWAVRCKMVDSSHFNLSLVVDGVEVSTGSLNFNHIAISDQIMAVGDGSAPGVDSPLKGVLDELGLFSGYLSLEEIAVNAAGNPAPAGSPSTSLMLMDAWIWSIASKTLALRFSQEPWGSEAFDAASYAVTGRTILSADGLDSTTLTSGYLTDPTLILLTLDALDPSNPPAEVSLNTSSIQDVANTVTTTTGNKVKLRVSSNLSPITPQMLEGPYTLGGRGASFGEGTSIFIGDIGPTGAPPTVTFSPIAGSSVGQFDAVTIDVATQSLTSQLKAVVITVIPGTGQSPETAFSGTQLNVTGYSSGYSANSTVSAIPGGYRFSVERTAGWLSSGPQFIVQAFDSDGQLVPASASFVYPPPPGPAAIALVQVIDARALDVIFSRPVVQSEALVASNYQISPTLGVLSVQKIDDYRYRLTTQKQTELANYTVTVQNIHAQDGNLIS